MLIRTLQLGYENLFKSVHNSETKTFIRRTRAAIMWIGYAEKESFTEDFRGNRAW